MARPRSDLFRSFGKVFSLFKEVVDAVLDLGGNDEDILRINKDKVVAKNVAYLLFASRQSGDLRGGFGGTLVAIRNPLTGELIRVGEPFYIKLPGSLTNQRAWGVVTTIYPPSPEPHDRPLRINYPVVHHDAHGDSAQLIEGSFGFGEIEKS